MNYMHSKINNKTPDKKGIIKNPNFKGRIKRITPKEQREIHLISNAKHANTFVDFLRILKSSDPQKLIKLFYLGTIPKNKNHLWDNLEYLFYNNKEINGEKIIRNTTSDVKYTIYQLENKAKKPTYDQWVIHSLQGRFGYAAENIPRTEKLRKQELLKCEIKSKQGHKRAEDKTAEKFIQNENEKGIEQPLKKPSYWPQGPTKLDQI
jgi:hypothetical protein